MPNPPDFQERSFKFACRIVKLYRTLLSAGLPAHLALQILKSGTSVGSNLEEAKGAQSRHDLIAKFHIALKEARETSYWLRLIAATQLAAKQIVETELDEANQLIAILTTSLLTLKGD